MPSLPQTVLLAHSAKVFSDAEYLARTDAKQVVRDKIVLGFAVLGAGACVTFEYVTLATILTALLFVGGMSGFGNALVVLVLTIGYHTLVEIDGAKDLETVMRRMAKLAIPLIAIALSSLVAFQLFTGTLDFFGSTGGDSGYSEGGGAPAASAVDVGLAFAEAVGALLAPIPALLVLVACVFLLVVSLHTVHVLIGVIDRRLEVIQSTKNRHPAVRAYRERIEERARQASRIETQIKIVEAQLPENLRRSFANEAYSVLTRTLNEMRRQIEMLQPGAEDVDLFRAGRTRKQPLPADITDIEIGRKRIAEIRDAIRPAAIKAALDGEYANEPDITF